MNNRIIELIKAESLTAIKFAEILDVQPSNISHIISGRNKPGYDFIVKVLERFPDVNPDWLLLGKGEMYKGRRKTQTTYNTPSNYETQHTMPDLESIMTSGVQNLADFAPQTLGDRNTQNLTPNSSERAVVKIILFYSDNSFEVFNGLK